jgi:hypothetical protein
MAWFPFWHWEKIKMSIKNRSVVAAFAGLFLTLAVAGVALAQDGCVVQMFSNRIVVAGCVVEQATVTPAPTVTPIAAATSTQTATPTSTAAPQSGLRVNVPLINAPAGDPVLDANNWSIITAGRMSPDGGYTQMRLAGLRDGLRLYVQVMTPRASGSFAVQVGSRTQTVTHKATAGWTFAERCNTDGCRGWTASTLIPWQELGGLPAEGDVWPLSLQGAGGAWAGSLRWGLPDYAGRAVEGAQIVTVPLSADSMVGGGTDCGVDDHPDYFPTWGGRNWGASPYVNVQAQWDVADWPCYSRYFARWSLDGLPAGAQVVSATVTMRHFGNGGYGAGYAEDGTKDTVIQVYEVSGDWQDGDISWDGAPAPGENVSRTLVRPIDVTCGKAYCNPGIAVDFDVTAIVHRAVAAGRPSAGMGLYTAAGQYHSGKYFWSREGGNQAPAVRIAYVMEDQWTPASPSPSPTMTFEPSPSSTSTPEPSVSPPPVTPSATPEPPTPTSTATATPSAPPSSCTRTVTPSDNLATAINGLRPGDTLCLSDGTYYQSIAPTVSGLPDKPITIKALNDGAATIDGQGVRKPINLGENGAAQGNWFVIEGIVARNGTEHVAIVKGSNNVLRRVSVYDANTNVNSQPVLLWGTNNLVEDCIVGGTGRFMIDIFGGGGVNPIGNNTVRRCFVKWDSWDGKNFCGISWPGVFGMGVYNSSGNTLENNIVYGRSMNNFVIQANSAAAAASNNRILGNMSVLAGKDYDGSLWRFGSPTWPALTRPQPTKNPFGPLNCDTQVVNLQWPGQRVGMQFFGQGVMADNVFRDNLVADAAALGFSANNPGGGAWTGTVIERLTAFGNGADAPSADGGRGTQVKLPPGVACQDCRIEGGQQGAGARLQTRYVDGALTDVLVLPLPMEGRAQAELGISINAIWSEYAAK